LTILYHTAPARVDGQSVHIDELIQRFVTSGNNCRHRRAGTRPPEQESLKKKHLPKFSLRDTGAFVTVFLEFVKLVKAVRKHRPPTPSISAPNISCFPYLDGTACFASVPVGGQWSIGA